MRLMASRLVSHGLLAALIAMTLVIAAQSAAAATRKAFVVGNSTYVHATSLPNPANDARDLAAKLKGLGYEVTLGLDLTRADFLKRFQDFARSLQQDDVALVYYAGHALQIGGENYLFPTDAAVQKEADARTRLVPLNALLADVTRASRNRIVILDACRNNPFAEEIAVAQATRSMGQSRGLARVYAGVGSFIAYSTQPGNIAADGAGRNSPFTDALLKHIGQQGADVHAVMRRVRADVQRATAELQIPWENSSLVDEVTFAGGAARPPQPRLRHSPRRSSRPRRRRRRRHGHRRRSTTSPVSTPRVTTSWLCDRHRPPTAIGSPPWGRRPWSRSPRAVARGARSYCPTAPAAGRTAIGSPAAGRGPRRCSPRPRRVRRRVRPTPATRYGWSATRSGIATAIVSPARAASRRSATPAARATKRRRARRCRPQTAPVSTS